MWVCSGGLTEECFQTQSNVSNVPVAFLDRTKIFIRFPQTLFVTEDAFQAKKPALGMLTLFLFCFLIHLI